MAKAKLYVTRDADHPHDWLCVWLSTCKPVNEAKRGDRILYGMDGRDPHAGYMEMITERQARDLIGRVPEPGECIEVKLVRVEDS